MLVDIPTLWLRLLYMWQISWILLNRYVRIVIALQDWPNYPCTITLYISYEIAISAVKRFWSCLTILQLIMLINSIQLYFKFKFCARCSLAAFSACVKKLLSRYLKTSAVWYPSLYGDLQSSCKRENHHSWNKYFLVLCIQSDYIKRRSVWAWQKV